MLWLPTKASNSMDERIQKSRGRFICESRKDASIVVKSLAFLSVKNWSGAAHKISQLIVGALEEEEEEKGGRSRRRHSIVKAF